MASIACSQTVTHQHALAVMLPFSPLTCLFWPALQDFATLQQTFAGKDVVIVAFPW